MRYEVDWQPSAEADLQRFWKEADNPIPVGVAMENIERRLSTDPFLDTKPRADGRRYMFEAPLAVAFRADAAVRKVLVLQVWLIRMDELN